MEWHHEFNDEATTFFSEIGDDGYEMRKIQKYRDGRLLKADRNHETSHIGLSEVPVGELDDVNAQIEFTALHIAPKHFEALWRRADWPQSACE
ncbi:hypothetical protein [Streptomyces sp. ISL-12]|uniref:DUF6881 domain-containing protein n=1 Tax=Streptomyces sp. ISL-12 TaxID=2819177 RepID=UPI002035EDA7|nr:hypothetical protein [Streptomyces sp. ISL-12]